MGDRHLSPQGYNIIDEPINENPFWDIEGEETPVEEVETNEQALSPQGYNILDAPVNTNPFWGGAPAPSGDYYTKEEIDTLLANFYNKSESDNKYALKSTVYVLDQVGAKNASIFEYASRREMIGQPSSRHYNVGDWIGIKNSATDLSIQYFVVATQEINSGTVIQSNVNVRYSSVEEEIKALMR